ncbi:MAG: GAF domain-containing protein [Magnetococcales bacterium]|nr:GAF domain-containing protein [Magnetococcales bacterium]
MNDNNSLEQTEDTSQLSAKYLRKQVYLVIGGIFAIIVSLVMLGLVGMEAVSGMRGFVGAEGLWSKSQKRAVFNIVRYATNKEERNFIAYKKNLLIPAGYKQARLELEKKNPNMDIAYQGFLQGGVHHDDVKNMARLFRWFRNFEYVDKAISLWARADVLIVAFEMQGESLHKLVLDNDPQHIAGIEEITQNIIQLDSTLTNLEYEFSYTLGEAARWAKGLLFKVMLVSAIIATIICVWLIMFVGQLITKMQVYSSKLDMQRSELLKQSEELTISNRLATGQSQLDAQMRGELTIDELSQKIITFLAEYLNIPVGALYVNIGDDNYVFKAGYSFSKNSGVKTEFSPGEGLLGQAVVDKKVMEVIDIPHEYLQISSSLGSGIPSAILVVPFVYNETVVAVIELASFEGFTVEQKEFINTVANSISISIHSRQHL